MQYRRLGRTNLKASAIGFGGIPISRPDKRYAIDVIKRAIDLGINYFDTARGYLDSEERLGEAIKGRRDKCIIASKSGNRTKDIIKDVEASLKALQTDYIDIYKFHGIVGEEAWQEITKPGGALEGLKLAKEQGKIRYIGASGHRPETLIAPVKSGEISVILLVFNYIRDEATEELFPLCQELDIGVSVMKPLGGSLFTPPDLFLRWVLQHQVVSTVPVGMWRIEEVEENAKIGETVRALTEDEKLLIAQEYQRYQPTYCRLCYKHQSCPNGVAIDFLMNADMFYRRHGLKWFYNEFKRALLSGENCKKCRQCVESCPYHLPIPEVVEQALNIYRPIMEWYDKLKEAQG